jgi:hypothetical protein
MKKLITVFGVGAILAVCAPAADFTGFVMDKDCSSNKGMIGDEACAKRCIERGSPAVLVTSDGKVYAIADQDKVKPAAGKKVTIAGKLEGDTIKVDNVKVL